MRISDWSSDVCSSDLGYAGNADIAWDKLTPEQRTIQIRKMATHAAMIEIMDKGIGRVIQALKDSGQYENTVIIYLNDNGASPEIMTQPGYDRPSETRDGRTIEYGEYPRSEEHTSELQSPMRNSYTVLRLTTKKLQIL